MSQHKGVFIKSMDSLEKETWPVTSFSFLFFCKFTQTVCWCLHFMPSQSTKRNGLIWTLMGIMVHQYIYSLQLHLWKSACDSYRKAVTSPPNCICELELKALWPWARPSLWTSAPISLIWHLSQLQHAIEKWNPGTSLVVQWLRIHFIMQVMWVQSLVGELSFHMPGATKPMCHKDPAWPNKTFHVPQLRPGEAKYINIYLFKIRINNTEK